MPNWVNAYAKLKGRKEDVEELFQFFLDPTKDNNPREDHTYFYRSFLEDIIEETEEGDIKTIDFTFYIAWEMTNNLTGTDRTHNCANLVEQATRLKVDVKIEGEEESYAFKQTIEINAFETDKPTWSTDYEEGEEYTCPNCEETDRFFMDSNKQCWNCNDEME